MQLKERWETLVSYTYLVRAVYLHHRFQYIFVAGESISVFHRPNICPIPCKNLPKAHINILEGHRKLYFQAKNVYFQLRNIYIQLRYVYLQAGDIVFFLLCEVFQRLLRVFRPGFSSF